MATYRVNILLDEQAWVALQEIPRGERSRLVCEAIKRMSDLAGKIKAAKKMDTLRQKLPKSITTAEITGWIREDRKR